MKLRAVMVVYFYIINVSVMSDLTIDNFGDEC